MRTTLLLALALLSGCTMFSRHGLDDRYGKPDPARFDVPAMPQHGMSYRDSIQPILNRRCVVCHACYDAQCQLKLTAFEGIARGATGKTIYDALRLVEAPTSRLFVDARTPSQWRAREFHPVLNERDPAPEADRSASVLFRVLDMKRRHPLPDVAVLPKSFQFSLAGSSNAPASRTSIASKSAIRSGGCRSACPASAMPNMPRSCTGWSRVLPTKVRPLCHRTSRRPCSTGSCS